MQESGVDFMPLQNLSRCSLTQGPVRPHVIVILPPVLDRRARVFDACEPVQVQAVGSELAVEALDEGVLGRLARLDEVQLHAGSPGPEEHGLRGEFGTIVHTERRY